MLNNKEIFCASAHTGKLVTAKGFEVCCQIQRNQSDTDVPGEEYREYVKDKLRRGVRLNECRRCWVKEEAGLKSYRKQNNSILVSKAEKELLINDHNAVLGVRHLEIILSNVCNLACQMCEPILSTKWMSTVKTKDAFTDEIFGRKYEYSKVYHNTYAEDDIKNLKVIKLMGGEPFYMKESFELLKRLDELDRCKEMEFHTPTNCMVFPDADIIDIILSFKRVFINASFDSVGELNDYIRMHSNWDQVMGNFKKWHELAVKHKHVDLIMSNTVTILNVNRIHEFMKYFLDYVPLNSLHPTPTEYPNHLSISLLPKKVGLPLIEPIKDINYRVYKMIRDVMGSAAVGRWPNLGSLKGERDILGLKIKAHFKSVEKVLGKTFKDVNPEMAEIIEDIVGDMR